MPVGANIEERRVEILTESKANTVDLKNGFFRTIPPTCVSDPYKDPSELRRAARAAPVRR